MRDSSIPAQLGTDVLPEKKRNIRKKSVGPRRQVDGGRRRTANVERVCDNGMRDALGEVIVVLERPGHD
jgi:hypothetical protein